VASSRRATDGAADPLFPDYGSWREALQSVFAGFARGPRADAPAFLYAEKPEQHRCAWLYFSGLAPDRPLRFARPPPRGAERFPACTAGDAS